MTLHRPNARFDAPIAGQATYGMATLRPEKTGLPFIVFISQRDDARQAARVKVSPAPRVVKESMGAYAIAPFGHKAGERLDGVQERLLAAWIDRNCAVLQDYWEGRTTISKTRSPCSERFDAARPPVRSRRKDVARD